MSGYAELRDLGVERREPGWTVDVVRCETRWYEYASPFE